MLGNPLITTYLFRKPENNKTLGKESFSFILFFSPAQFRKIYPYSFIFAEIFKSFSTIRLTPSLV